MARHGWWEVFARNREGSEWEEYENPLQDVNSSIRRTKRKDRKENE